MKPRRIVIISELFHPEQSATGYILTRIAEGLARAFPVQVICGQPSYLARGVRAPAREEWHGMEIRRCSATTLDKDRLLFRAVNAATITMSIFWEAIRSLRRGDAALVVTNPPILPFVVAVACRIRSASCVVLVHDLYPELAVASGVTAPSSLPARTVAGMNRMLFTVADRIVVLGRDMRERIERRYGQMAEKLVVIPNWGDVDILTPAPPEMNALVQKHGLQGRFIALYAGNMGRTHGLETVVESMRILRDDPHFHFLLIGSGAKKPWLQKAIADHGLKNATLLDSLPREEQQEFLNAGHVGLVSFVSDMAGVSVPSRMYNIFAAGKPIVAVADRDSELAQVLAENGIGWVVTPGDAPGLARTLGEARRDPERLRSMGRAARILVEQTYTLDSAVDAYRELFSSLGGA